MSGLIQKIIGGEPKPPSTKEKLVNWGMTQVEKISDALPSSIFTTLDRLIDDVTMTAEEKVNDFRDTITETFSDQSVDVEAVVNYFKEHLMGPVDGTGGSEDNVPILNLGSLTGRTSAENDRKKKESKRRSKARKMLNWTKSFIRALPSSRKVVKLMVIGCTQVGKTSSIHKLLGIDVEDDESDDESGDESDDETPVGSDTKDVICKEYKRDGCTIQIYDTPGFYDTRGKDIGKENKEKIINEIGNIEPDVILFFSKLDDELDQTKKDIIDFFEKKFPGFAKRCMVFITYAASGGIPVKVKKQRMFRKLEKGEEREIAIWKYYVTLRKNIWKNYFEKKTGKIIPIVLFENDDDMCPKYNDADYLLPDGTPVLETAMTKIGIMLKSVKALTAINFTSLSENKKMVSVVENSISNVAANNTSPKVEKITVDDSPEPIYVPVTSTSDTSSNNGSSGSWCVIL